jgi:hypothetical protein
MSERSGSMSARATGELRTYAVIPAKAGIQCGKLCWRSGSTTSWPGLVHWAPAFAGVTIGVRRDDEQYNEGKP